MDRYSEVEAKWETPNIEPAQVLAFATEVKQNPILKPYGYQISGALMIGGWDTYYQQGEAILRHRCDGEKGRESNCLTTKTRKSSKDLLDRHEVDLFLRADAKPEDVETFLERTGWKPLFTINKQYTVIHLRSSSGPENIVCLAIYDVWADSRTQARRFLEVEIERDSECTTAQGRAALKKWVAAVQAGFGIGEPVNRSLFELYSKEQS